MFENRVLSKISGPECDKVTMEWRRPHNKELYNLYSTPNIIWVIKSRRMSWIGQAERMGKRTGTYQVLEGKPKETIWKTEIKMKQ